MVIGLSFRPQYNFGSVPAEKRVDLNLDEQQQQQPPIEEVAPTIEEDMRYLKIVSIFKHVKPISVWKQNVNKKPIARLTVDNSQLNYHPSVLKNV